jgi:cell wall-associated NlpC family hydrolase
MLTIGWLFLPIQFSQCLSAMRSYFSTSFRSMFQCLALSVALLWAVSCTSFKQQLKTSGDLPIQEYSQRQDLLGRPKHNNDSIQKNKPNDQSIAEKPAPKEKSKSIARAELKKKKAAERLAARQAKQAAKLAAKKARQSRSGQSFATAEPAKQKVPKPEQPNPVQTIKDPRTLRVITTAESYLNTPYQWGGMTKNGVDCSALAVLAYKEIGMSIPRVSGSQASQGIAVNRQHLRPGDLLFFSSGRPGVIGHTAIVVQAQNQSVKFIHATSGHGVRYDYLEQPHWNKLYISARRYLE